MLGQVFLLTLLMIGNLALQGQVQGDEPPREKLAVAVDRMLSTGLGTARVGVDQLKSEQSAVQSMLGQRHPYLDFAYYLTLKKNVHTSQAAEVLAVVVADDAPVVFLAHEELVRLQLREKKYSAAQEQLVDLAIRIGKVSADAPEADEAHRSAHWLGTAVAFLQGPLGVEEVAHDANLLPVPIRQYLGEQYSTSFDLGIKQVGILHHDLGQRLIEATRQAEEQKRQQAVEAQRKQAELAGKKEEIKTAAGDLQAVAREDLSDMTSKIDALEKLFEDSLKSEQVILASQAQLRIEIAQLQQQYSLSKSIETGRATGPVFGRNTTILASRELESLISVKQLQLLSAANDYALLLQSRDQTTKQAQSLVAQRNAIAGTYQSRAGDVLSRLAALDRLQQRVANSANKEAAAKVSQSTVVMALKKRIGEFSTYAKSELSDQRDRLLQLAGDRKNEADVENQIAR